MIQNLCKLYSLLVIKCSNRKKENDEEKTKVKKSKDSNMFSSNFDWGEFDQNHLRNEAKSPNEADDRCHFVHLVISNSFDCIELKDEHIVHLKLQKYFHDDPSKEN